MGEVQKKSISREREQKGLGFMTLIQLVQTLCHASISSYDSR
jgi:hypothetical protein